MYNIHYIYIYIYITYIHFNIWYRGFVWVREHIGIVRAPRAYVYIYTRVSALGFRVA